MSTEPIPAVVSEGPKTAPARNIWKLASIALGIAAVALLVLIIVIVVAQSIGDESAEETAVPTVSTLRRACVTFDEVDADTTFGTPTKPGTEVLTEEGVAVRIQRFLTTFGIDAFESVEIVEQNPSLAFGSDNYAALNQISLEFDFAGLPFDVREVAFDFFEFESSSSGNLGVNRGDPYQGLLTRAPDTINGVSWSVSESSGARQGTLTGPVEELRIGGGGLLLSVGGAGLLVDTVCASP